MVNVIKHAYKTCVIFHFEWFAFRLKHSIAKLAKKSQENYSNNYIISITTYPNRFKFAKKTLKSLIMQKTEGILIVMFLFEKDYVKKNYFKSFQKWGLCIESYPRNLKSYLKIIPALERYRDKIIITADDDMFYSKTWLNELINAHQARPDVIFGHRGLKLGFDHDGKAKPYTEWKQIKLPYVNDDLIITSVGGVIYPAGVFGEKVLDMELAFKLSPKNDDLWIYFMALEKNIKCGIVLSTNQDPYFWLGSQKIALWKSNVLDGFNDKQFEKLSNWFKRFDNHSNSNK